MIGVSEAVTMAVTAPSWAPLVSFSLLILVARRSSGSRSTVAPPWDCARRGEDRDRAAPLSPRSAAFPLGLPRSTNRSSTWCCHWIVLATSWNILSGYSGYFSFGHGAFFGAGMYTTATLRRATTCRSCGRCRRRRSIAALLGARARRGRRFASGAFAASCSRCVTLAVTLRRRHDRAATRRSTAGPGVYLSAVPVPKLGPTRRVVVLPAGARRGA